MGLFNWILNLNIFQTWMLLGAVCFCIFGLMSILSAMTKDTIDSHFDRFTIFYLFVFAISVIPVTLVLLYKINTSLFSFVLFIVVFSVVGFVSRTGTRYSRFGRVTYGSGNTSIISKYWRRRQLRMRRREALRAAKAFIAPYRSLFGKQVLSNKYCRLVFSKEKLTYKFFCISKIQNAKGELPFFEAKTIDDSIWHEEFFNSLCSNFSFSTKIENLYSVFEKDRFMVDDSNYSVTPAKTVQHTAKAAPKQNNKDENVVQQIIEQININTATEAELTALPGISIVLAKKIIHHRDYNGEFKSVEEFIELFKIKPHFAQQLKKLVLVQPFEQGENKKQCERILDIDE